MADHLPASRIPVEEDGNVNDVTCANTLELPKTDYLIDEETLAKAQNVDQIELSETEVKPLKVCKIGSEEWDTLGVSSLDGGDF